MKIGVDFKIDVTKLDRSRFFKGKKGTYCDLTVFIDTENASQYGDNGVITQAVSYQERQDGVQMPIIGNARVFYTDCGQSQDQQNHGQQKRQNDSMPHDDVPF